jgi:putative SOS response-associated peptidase YedK
MCGRYVCEEDQSIDLAALYRAVRISHPDVTLKSGEIFPTETVPLLMGREVTPAPAAWGFRGFDGKGIIINARAETAAVKPAFADAVRGGRCVIPATGYFEWTPTKEKHRFSPADGELLYMAGLCRVTPEGLRFVILTTPASPVPLAASVHPRMPLLLPAPSVGDWIREPAFARHYLQSPAVTAIPLLDTRVG